MSIELEIDLTTIEGIRSGLKEIRERRHYLLMMKGEIETSIEKLNKTEKDCIEAFIRGTTYPYQSTKLCLPENLCKKE